MKKLHNIGLIVLMFITTQTNAQNSFSFSCTRDTTINGCVNPCLTLKAKIPNIHSSTSDYVINPMSGPGGCFRQYVSPATPGVATNLTSDDTYSGVISIPFPFPFYDDAASPYTSLVLSTNGFLSFDASNANAYAHWSMTPGNVPNTGYDRSLVMGVFHDIDPFYTTSPNQRIKYEVLGTAPHRRFVFSVYKVPQFSTTCQNLINNTHQIVLYEGLGVIEVFVNEVEQCPSWNQGRKMIGLQNYAKTKGIMAPGRTATGPNWGSTNMNESWRFVPAAGPTLFRGVELFDLNGNLVATGDTTNIGNQTFEVSFPNVCPAGTTTYIVKSKYAQFNNPNAYVYGTDTINVISNNPLSATSATIAASCANQGIGSAIINVSGAPGPFEFSTDGGLTWQPSNVINLPQGVHVIKFRQIGGNCIGTTTITITADPNLVAGQYSVSNVLCSGQSNGTINVTGLNGTGIFEYSINGGTTYQSSGIFNNLPAGVYNVRVRDNSGCIRDTVITVLQPAPVTATVDVTDATCSATPNGQLIVEASGGSNVYEYSINGTTFQTNPIFNVTEGTYTVTIRDNNGCVRTYTETVNLNNNLTVQSRLDTTVCLGASIDLSTVSNADAYTWTGNGLSSTSVQSPVATPTTLGANTYNVTATLGQCTATDVVIITVESQVNVNAGPDQTVLSGDLVQLNATVTGATSYLWTPTPSDPSLSSATIINPSATPLVTTTYSLTATNVAGCTSTDEVVVTVVPYCIRLRNAFSPNGDGINELWQVYDQFDCLTNVTARVYNRYGNVVFEDKNYKNTWDGKYKGKPVPDGTYYAVVEFTLVSGKKIVSRTDVNIIR